MNLVSIALAPLVFVLSIYPYSFWWFGLDAKSFVCNLVISAGFVLQQQQAEGRVLGQFACQPVDLGEEGAVHLFWLQRIRTCFPPRVF
jgi:hypothetical protein